MPELHDYIERKRHWVGEVVEYLGGLVAIGASAGGALWLAMLLDLGPIASLIFCGLIYLPAGRGVKRLKDKYWPSDQIRHWVLMGADGVLLCQAFSKPPMAAHRFLPYFAIKQIEKFHYSEPAGYEGSDTIVEGVELTLESGQDFRLHVGEGEADDLCRRLCEARGCCGEMAVNDAELFQRGDRSVEDWLNALDMLSLSSHEGYRAPSMSSERLWRVIDAPSANPTARAGAAFALLKSADMVDRERLLHTAQSAVAPGLDAAFEAVANESSDEALANALAAVEEPALVMPPLPERADAPQLAAGSTAIVTSTIDGHVRARIAEDSEAERVEDDADDEPERRTAETRKGNTSA